MQHDLHPFVSRRRYELVVILRPSLGALSKMDDSHSIGADRSGFRPPPGLPTPKEHTELLVSQEMNLRNILRESDFWLEDLLRFRSYYPAFQGELLRKWLVHQGARRGLGVERVIQAYTDGFDYVTFP